MLEPFLTEVRRIAPQLPTGLTDPRAAEKLATEQSELAEKLNATDQVGALTELADVAYYAAKAVLNALIDPKAAEVAIRDACAACSVESRIVLLVMRAKYAIRATGRKNDAEERTAVACAAQAHVGIDGTYKYSNECRFCDLEWPSDVEFPEDADGYEICPVCGTPLDGVGLEERLRQIFLPDYDCDG
jgi:hypothetical protein